MDDDNTQGGAEPSSASAGSVANDQAEVLAKGIADIIRTAAEPDWIPVTERLPNRGEWVLAYGPHYSHIVAECDRGEWRSVYRDSETGEPWLREAGMVTHWMPLPAPPSDDE
jgi:hypothetical protein